MKAGGEAAEDWGQQKTEPSDETAEVVADGGQDGVDGVALAMSGVVATHSMFGLEMADDGLRGGAPAQLALDLGGHPPLLS